ncbi:zinc ribbon domain-containing protein [bacterium]|nr:zinc ribbon domain-containing protein [bacterium]
MPIYSFICEDCGHQFEKFFIKIVDKFSEPCPKCNSYNTTKQLDVFTSRNAGKNLSSIDNTCSPSSSFG